MPPATRSPWDFSTTVRASVGWRENVTVSAVQSLNRAFGRGEAELFAIRPLGDHAQFLSFLSGDVLRYFSPPAGVPGEQQWIADLQARWQPTGYLRTTVKTVGFLQDTFIDPSQTEGALQRPIWVKVRGGYGVVAQRVALPWGFAVEPSVQVKRITYRGYAGDFNEVRPGVALEWKRSDKLVLTATWYDHRRHYAELLAARGLSGAPDPGHILSLYQREGELRAASTLNGGGKWTIGATVGRLENRDRATGYLDYDQKRAAVDLTWEVGRWRTIASGEVRQLTYLKQTVGTGAGTPRVTEAYNASLRLERDVGGKWTVFAEDRWERNRSNVADLARFHPFSYRTATLSVGLQRSF